MTANRFHLVAKGPQAGSWLKCVAQAGQCPYGDTRHPSESEVIQDAISAFKSGEKLPVLIDPSGRPNKAARVKRFKFNEDGSFTFGSRAYDTRGERTLSERQQRRVENKKLQSDLAAVYKDYPIEADVAEDDARYAAQLEKDRRRDEAFLEVYWHHRLQDRARARDIARKLSENLDKQNEDGKTLRDSLPKDQRYVSKAYQQSPVRKTIWNWIRYLARQNPWTKGFLSAFDASFRAA